MRLVGLSALLLATLCHLGAGADIIGRITDPPGVQTFEKAGIKLTLNGGEYTTWTTSDGSFSFAEIPSGVHMLEVETKELVYSVYKLNVQAQEAAVQAVEYRYPGAPKLLAAYPLSIVPVAKAVFFEERQQTSVFSFLKNPSILMMIVMGFLVVCMPRMMNNMDPETKRELEEQQAAMGGGDPMSILKGLLSGGEPPAAAPAPAPPARAPATRPRDRK